jgi:hypothetical protein
MPTTSALKKNVHLPKIPEPIARAPMRLVNFLFPADNGQWLSVLRIGLGIQVVFYALSLMDDWNFLLAEHGLIGRALSEGLLSRESPFVPRLGWFVAAGAGVGLSEWTVLSLAWCLLVVAGCGLAVGIFSRAWAIVAWFVHLSAASSGGLVSYGVDNFMTIGLFYLMLAPLPDRFALEHRWQRTRVEDRQPRNHASSRSPSELFGFWRRLLQVHLCFIYFFGGLAKALGSGWWNGASLWRTLTRSPFNLIPAETLISLKYVFPLAGIAVCFLELGYPCGIWHKRTRFSWLICIIAMHIAIGLGMGMYLFSLVMIVLNAAAFGPELLFARMNRAESNTDGSAAESAAAKMI